MLPIRNQLLQRWRVLRTWVSSPLNNGKQGLCD